MGPMAATDFCLARTGPAAAADDDPAGAAPAVAGVTAEAVLMPAGGAGGRGMPLPAPGDVRPRGPVWPLARSPRPKPPAAVLADVLVYTKPMTAWMRWGLNCVAWAAGLSGRSHITTRPPRCDAASDPSLRTPTSGSGRLNTN